jgi:hypothetical protein
MTTKIKDKGLYEGVVKDIQNAYKTKGEKYLHLITFEMPDGTRYTAEESENDPVSRFTIGEKSKFELTHPGKPGTFDWVRFVSTESNKINLPPGKLAISKDDLIAAQTAMNCATQLGLKWEWTIEQIVNNAYTLAGNIKVIARNIGEEI